MTNRYLDRIPPQEIPKLKAISDDLYNASQDAEDWANRLGRYYVQEYGRPSEYDSFFGIGCSLITHFAKSK